MYFQSTLLLSDHSLLVVADIDSPQRPVIAASYDLRLTQNWRLFDAEDFAADQVRTDLVVNNDPPRDVTAAFACYDITSWSLLDKKCTSSTCADVDTTTNAGLLVDYTPLGTLVSSVAYR